MPSTKLKKMGVLLAMFVDYARFRLRYRHFAARCGVADPDKTVLIVSLTDWLMQVKIEAVLAKALQCRGYTPVILTNRTARWAQLYFRAFGVTRFIFFDQMCDKEVRDSDNRQTQEILSSASFASILEVTRDGINVGQHVLSTLVRKMRNGSISFSDPEVGVQLKQRFPASFRTARAAEKLLDDIRPSAVLFLEKGYTPYGEVFDAALKRGLNVIQYVHSHKSDSLVMKRYNEGNRRQHVFSFGRETWERVKRLPWDKAQEEAFMAEIKEGYEKGTWFNRKFLLKDKKLKSPEEVRRQLGLDPTKKTAVIFSHVLWDATFFYGRNLFLDYEEWLIETVKAACGNDRVNWLIKLHPDYIWKMKQMGDTSEPRDIIALDTRIGRLPDHVKVVRPDTDISTYSFFAVIDYCITVRGTIGTETPCFGIPVFTAGTGRFSGLGFSNDSETREEYLGKMRRIQDSPRLSPEETSLARRHACHLFTRRPLTFTSFSLIRGKTEARGSDIAIHVRTPADIANAADLNAFANWVLDSRDEDYLNAP